MKFDLILRNGLVLDGRGEPPFAADVGLKGGRVARLGRLGRDWSGREIDVGGRLITPGFIDSHSHADLTLVTGSVEDEKLRMGVTTEVIGQCGFSPYPSPADRPNPLAGLMAPFLPGAQPAWNWTDLESFAQLAETRGLTHNFVPLVGHGTLRRQVVGPEDRSASRSQLERMRRLLEGAMDQGAFGLSSGLIYAPACFAETAEVALLAETAAARGGVYVTHVRGETARLIDAAQEEALFIARASGAGLQVSHLKVIGLEPEARRRVRQVIGRLEAAREDGLDVWFDCYPYTEGSTLLSSLLPREALAGGAAAMVRRLGDHGYREHLRRIVETDATSWENWLFTCGYDAVKLASLRAGRPSPLAGMTLGEIARTRQTHPFDTLCDILAEEHGDVVMVFTMMDEEDMLAALVHPLGLIGTDAIPCPPGRGRPHPRGYGAFPRVLGRYVRQEGRLGLPEAVAKMTSRPAARWGLADRGVVAEGMMAELVVLDPAVVADQADYDDPRRPPLGIDMVLVNGLVAVKADRVGQVRAGRVIRRPPRAR